MKPNPLNLLHQLQQLVSENNLLKLHVEEQQQLAILQEKRLRDLKIENDANRDAVSKLDNQAHELEILQDYLNFLQQQQDGSHNRQEDLHQQLLLSIREHHELQDLQQQHSHLQVQFADLQMQLEEANKRNQT